MSRGNYAYIKQSDFSGGIEENHEDAKPNQVLEAGNVWCPDKLLEGRPGQAQAVPRNSNVAAWATAYGIWYDASLAGGTYTNMTAGTGVLTAPFAMIPDDILYIGDTGTGLGAHGFNIAVPTPNASACKLCLEFWNGSMWYPIPFYENNAGTGAFIHFGGAVDSSIHVCIPSTSTLFVVNGISAYWVRFRIIEGAIDAGTVLDFIDPSTVRLIPATSSQYYPMVLQTPTARRAIQFIDSVSAKTVSLQAVPYGNYNSVVNTFNFITIDTIKAGGLPVIAPVPQFNEVFAAFGHSQGTINLDTNTVIPSVVESRPEYVGTIGGVKSPYHPDYVVQLSGWPRGKYTAFFNGQLWSANLENEPFTVRWSAPQPAYKVWPAISYEVLVENDESPITGLGVLGEHLCVFKRNSIWRMVYNGVSPLGELNTYVPVKVPGNIGTVSHHSIQEINGVLVFLAEDGVYAFDGVSEPKKLSGPIDSKIQKISRGEEDTSVSCHWPDKHVYMLSIPQLGESESRTLLLYDYATAAWWEWTGDNITWLYRIEGTADRNEIWTGTVDQMSFTMAGPCQKHGGVPYDQHIRTHRLGYDDGLQKSLREVRVSHQSTDMQALEVEVVADDLDEAPQTASLDLSLAGVSRVGTATLVDDTAPLLVAGDPRDRHKASMRKSGEWMSVEIRNDSEAGKTFKLHRIEAGFIPWSKR